jgi:hypothetical protein
MHHIKISLTEFLSNGGKLHEGRAIYCKPSGMQSENGIMYAGGYVKTENYNKVVFLKNGNFFFPLAIKESFVEIQVTPIYE